MFAMCFPGLYVFETGSYTLLCPRGSSGLLFCVSATPESGVSDETFCICTSRSVHPVVSYKYAFNIDSTAAPFSLRTVSSGLILSRRYRYISHMCFPACRLVCSGICGSDGMIFQENVL